MDLRHLRYFVCVAEEMHFGRAALRLGISQPPLSQQIRALEDELRVTLFERTSRRVRLTEAGRLFLPEAGGGLTPEKHTIAVARRAEIGELGRVGIGFSASAPFVPLVSRALRHFRRDYPLVSLDLAEVGRDEQIARIERGQLDIGIHRGVDTGALPAGVCGALLQVETMMAAVRSDHPLAPGDGPLPFEQLAGQPLILYGGPLGTGFDDYFKRQCQAHGFRPTVAFEAGSFATLLGLATAGLGVAILSRSLSRLSVGGLVYRELTAELESELWMIHQATPTPAAKVFLNALRNAAASEGTVILADKRDDKAATA